MMRDEDGRVSRSMIFNVGEHVTWLREPRDGYGSTVPVDTEILGLYPMRVRIRVAKRSGKLVERWVRPAHLIPK
jgi:hypothetical protein